VTPPIGERRLIVRRLGPVDYREAIGAMQAFTDTRGPETPDEIWLLEHPPVYTMGLKGRNRPLAPQLHDIPQVQTDRGGDLTYHGPGQLVAYVLLDLARLGVGIRELVRRLEQAAIEVLATHGLAGERRAGAPGVYVGGDKIAALGLRVRRGSSYHGLSLNVDMDLAPFTRIDPCGYPGLQATSLRSLGVCTDVTQVSEELVAALIRQLGYNGANLETSRSLHG
jgi:lipoyl(octanoyl) transferase